MVLIPACSSENSGPSTRCPCSLRITTRLGRERAEREEAYCYRRPFVAEQVLYITIVSQLRVLTPSYRGLDFTAQALRENVANPADELSKSFRSAYGNTL